MFLFDILEFIVDAIIDLWLEAMLLIIPERAKSKLALTIIKIVVWTFICLLFIVMGIGFFGLFSDDPDTKQLAEYMVFIPLGISAVQIAAGIVLRKVSKKKKQDK